jgi:signal transduction histidine kinase
MGIPLRVLIIEDSEDDALIVVRELKRAGYDVAFKRVDRPIDLKSALTGDNEWDLVISDFSMPTFSGTDALKLVRSLGFDAPFIFISGTMGEDTAVAALKDGAQDYLVKTNLKRLAPAVDRELREAEERRQRKRLEQHVHQLQKFEAIGRLAGGVAHDFNNLLGVILGQSEILLEQSQDERMTHGLQMILGSARRGAGLTRQLLAFGRRQVLKPKVLNINTILADVEKLLQRVIGEDVELDFQMDAGLGNVEADPAQLEQVIVNLATNARDAMSGGGKLTIATSNVSLDDGYADRRVVKPGRYVQLAVRDTGCGMDEETQSRVFEPFFTTKEQGKGTGLGLATVYGIVKQSGGYIWVYSEPGHGTSFKIYLPMVEAPAESSQNIKQNEELPQGTETILVVEDDASLREVTREFLQRSGYSVMSAGSPQEALQLAEGHGGRPIDFLLTDVIMPKMNGRELATRLIKDRPEMQVLYVSGYTDGIVRDGTHGALEEGLAFLEKPYTRQALLRKIREMLDSRQMQSPAKTTPT